MQVHQDAFIGYVDILGYNRLETRLNQLGQAVSSALLARVFQFLDTYAVSNSAAQGVTWIRYGDGYVSYASGDDIENLVTMAGQATTLLALALNQSIPLRVAITQRH